MSQNCFPGKLESRKCVFFHLVSVNTVLEWLKGACDPVTKPGSFSPTLSKSKHWDIKVCCQERVYSQRSQVKRQENKSQICLPEARGSGYLEGKEERSKVVWGSGGREKVIGKRCDTCCSAQQRLCVQKGSEWRVDTHTCPAERSVVPSSLHQLSLKKTQPTPCSWTTAQGQHHVV